MLQSTSATQIIGQPKSLEILMLVSLQKDIKQCCDIIKAQLYKTYSYQQLVQSNFPDVIALFGIFLLTDIKHFQNPIRIKFPKIKL